MKFPHKKASLAAVLLAGSLALTGCTAQHMPTVPTAQTQSAPLKIEVVGEAEMYLLPGAALKGKPSIHNVGSMDVYCFMQVEMPVFPSETVDLEADEPAADPVSLLCFTVSDVWTLVEQTEADGMRTAVYAYGTPMRLHPGETTDNLFTEWRVTNFRVRNGLCGDYTYRELTEKAAQFHIQGYAIQADHIGENLTPETLWQMLN